MGFLGKNHGKPIDFSKKMCIIQIMVHCAIINLPCVITS